MARNIQLLSLVFSIALSLALGPSSAGGSPIGVCYGMVANDLPPPREVIDMYKSNKIGRMRLYNPNQEALEALRDSSIDLLIGVKNEDLQQLASSNSATENWVTTNIKPYSTQVQFRYIAVGNEVIPGELAQYVLPTMQNLQEALSSGGLDHIKVSTSIATSILGESYPPSAANFSEAAMSYMAPIARYLNNVNAPLLANVYPYFPYTGNSKDIPLPYALFTSNSVVVADGGLSYYNLFDAMVDGLHASLEKAGAPRVRVVVSETGWPSDGNGNVTTPSNAHTYNSNLIKHVLSSSGTPRRPGSSIETYVFSMFNENMKPGDAVEQHWGLFYPNKSSVYPINFASKRSKHMKVAYYFLAVFIVMLLVVGYGKMQFD